MAKHGLNVVLVSRSLDKLNYVERNVQQINTAIKTRIIVADLCKEALNTDMYNNIAKQCADLDLAMIVNNAGVLYYGYFRNLTI